MEWLTKHYHRQNNHTYPNWPEVITYVDETYSDEQIDAAWDDIIHHWTDTLNDEFGPTYRKVETDNFIIITDLNDDALKEYISCCEDSLRKTLSSLRNIAYKYEKEKLVAIIAASQDDYYRYTSHFYPDGDFSLSSGMFIGGGAGHFIFTHVNHHTNFPVVSHEMTHALVSHLALPKWINEGLATNIEDMMWGSCPLTMDQELAYKHANFWNENTIQEFWSGHSFSRPDEGSELSYNLAQFLIRKLARSYDAFTNFCNEASFEDGGEKSLVENFGVSPQELIEPMMGEGNWAPKPELWDKS